MAWQIWEVEHSFLGVSSKSGEEDKSRSSLPWDDSLPEMSVLSWGNLNSWEGLSLFPKNTDFMDRSRMSNEVLQSFRAVEKAGRNIAARKINFIELTARFSFISE